MIIYNLSIFNDKTCQFLIKLDVSDEENEIFRAHEFMTWKVE